MAGSVLTVNTCHLLEITRTGGEKKSPLSAALWHHPASSSSHPRGADQDSVRSTEPKQTEFLKQNPEALFLEHSPPERPFLLHKAGVCEGKTVSGFTEMALFFLQTQRQGFEGGRITYKEWIREQRWWNDCSKKGGIEEKLQGREGCRHGEAVGVRKLQGWRTCRNGEAAGVKKLQG